jgi:hypothetical protein
MVDDINSDKNYIIKILDHHNGNIARKKYKTKGRKLV